MKTNVINHVWQPEGGTRPRALTVREFIEKLKYVVPERHMDDTIVFTVGLENSDPEEVAGHFDDEWIDDAGVQDGSIEHSTHGMWAEEGTHDDCVVVFIDFKEPECQL